MSLYYFLFRLESFVLPKSSLIDSLCRAIFLCFERVCTCHHFFGLDVQEKGRSFFFTTTGIILWRHHSSFSPRLFRSEFVSFILLNLCGRTFLKCKKGNIICHRAFCLSSFILLLFYQHNSPFRPICRYFCTDECLLFQLTRVCLCYMIVSEEGGHFNCTRNPSSIVCSVT